MSAKVALIVEPDFLERHWGVRVYLYSLAKVLRRHGWRTDFVFSHMSSGGDLRWYRLNVRDESLFSASAPAAAGTPSEVWSALRDAAFKEGARAGAPASASPGLRRPAVMPLGSHLEFEQYDLAIITNPWMVRWRERLPARRVAGLVFDLIPNLFGVLMDEGKPFAFAHQHEVGFRYYEEFCDFVLAISKATSDAYLDLVRRRRPGGVGPDVVTLPPIAPYDALEEPSRPCPPTRGARIALAGCFDLRKGLRELPGLLNGLSDVLEEVVIYGGARCRKADAEAFFKELAVERVVWHLGATSAQVKDIYRRSTLLLFPSRFEGLGLPLLEAQLEGCRVATYPVSPMKELALRGSVMLADDPAESITRLRTALRRRFDHAALRGEARAAFVDLVLLANPLERVLGDASGVASQRHELSPGPQTLEHRALSVAS
jgi:glycosyltransferase involved in cell wall biosynthesis